MTYRIKLPYFLLFLLLCGCSRPYKDIGAINEYLNDPDNGCIKSKSVNNIDFSVKYIPPSYMVLKKVSLEQGNSKALTDSLLKIEDKFLTFIMTIAPTPDSIADRVPIMYSGLEEEAGYTDRVFSMNFSLAQYLKLYTGQASIEPVAAIVENVYELSDSRNFLIMFPKENYGNKQTGKEVSFVFNDPYFNSGTLQFHFNNRDIVQADNLNVPWQQL